MRVGTLLHIILFLASSLSFFVIPFDLFCQQDDGYVVQLEMCQKRIYSCSYICGTIFYPAVSDIRVFGTPIQLVTKF